MRQTEKLAFMAGFARGKEWAIDRCVCEKVDPQDESDDAYNRGIRDCIEAIKALDVRHSPEMVATRRAAARGVLI